MSVIVAAQFPTITIDGRKFSLIKKMFNYNRALVNIQSESADGIVPFWAYASFSEVGLWRLCVYDENQLFKGIDYAQSSLIHLDLQEFINRNLVNLPEVVLTEEQIVSECGCSTATAYNIKDQLTERCKANVIDIYDTIESHERAINIPVFQSIIKKHITCGQPLTMAQIANMSSIIETAYECADNLTKLYPHQFEFNNRKETGISKINVVGDVYRVSLIGKNISITDGQSKALNEWKSKLAKAEAEANPKKNEFNIFYYNSKISEILDSVKPLPNLELYFFAGRLENLSVESENVDAGLPSHIYRNLNMVCGKPLHIFPFLLTTADSTVNHLGIYTKYVEAGAFICKLFDYDEQCANDEGTIKCTPAYSYIGERYAKMYPYNQLIGKIQGQTVCVVPPPPLLKPTASHKNPVPRKKTISKFPVHQRKPATRSQTKRLQKQTGMDIVKGGKRQTKRNRRNRC